MATLFFISQSQGQTVSVDKFEVNKSNVNLNQTGHKKNQNYSGSVKTEYTKYNTLLKEDRLNQSSSLLGTFRIETKSSNEYLKGVFDFSAERLVDWEHSQYSVKEIYAEVPFDLEAPETEISLGRKVYSWSTADDDWELGLWQPKQVFDGLRPEVQGLTGAFLNLDSENIQWLIFSSPIFIPTMEPEIKNENGSLSSTSRWFKTPSSSFLFLNRQRKIVYSVNTPDVSKLVLKPGAGTRLRLGKEFGLWSSVAVAEKPVNKLSLKYKKSLFSSEEGEDTGLAPLYPVVSYHSIFSADLGYNWEKFKLTYSHISETPRKTENEDGSGYIVQQLSASEINSVQAKLVNFFSNTDLSISYLKVKGGEIRDVDSEGKDQGAVFSDRFQYTDAVKFQAQIKSSVFNKRVLSKAKYIKEFDQKAILISLESAIEPFKQFWVSGGVDILGPESTAEETEPKGFLNEFRANDRAFLGVSYVF